MVQLRYDPTPLDLKKELTVLLRHIWNYNTRCDRREYIDCIFYEEWCICDDYDSLDLQHFSKKQAFLKNEHFVEFILRDQYIF